MQDPQATSACQAGGSECRCLCGSLLARVVPGGVELKCRRCKRLLLVPWHGEVAWPPAADTRPEPARRVHISID